MYIIKKANPIFNAVLGYRENRGKRKCKYVFAMECEEGLLLWNTLSLALVLVPGATVRDWKDQTLSADETEALEKNYFYLPDDFDEDKAIDDLKMLSHRYAKSTSSKYTIFTTSVCNARCVYCFEREHFTKKSMNEQTARDVVDFIIRTNTAEKFQIDWFGGEPLMNTKAIDIISKDLKDRGAKFNSRITSNGFLFSEELVGRAVKDWNLVEVQITLDGTAEVYANTKRYVGNPVNPLERVLHNISLLLLAGVRVSIRLNVSNDNHDDISLLIEQLYERFGNNNKLGVYLSPLYEFYHLDECDELKLFTQRYLSLNDKVHRLFGRRTRLPGKWPGNKCIADNDNTHTITCDGHLVRCEHCFDDGFTGDIYGGVRYPDVVDYWKESNKTDKCKTCEFNPVCYDLKHCPVSDGICNYLYKELRYYKYRGAVRAAYNRWREIRHDVAVDMEICGCNIGEYVQSVSQCDKEGKGYTGATATPYYVLDEIFKHVSLRYDKDKIIDVGCGKGRVIAFLLKEKLLPPASISGIEINPEVHSVVNEWTKRYNGVKIYLANAIDFDYNEYNTIFFSRPFLLETFKVFLENFENKMTHSVKFIYWSDQESGHILEGRQGWICHYKHKPTIWVHNGYAYLGKQLRGFSVWTFTPPKKKSFKI